MWNHEIVHCIGNFIHSNSFIEVFYVRNFCYAFTRLVGCTLVEWYFEGQCVYFLVNSLFVVHCSFIHFLISSIWVYFFKKTGIKLVYQNWDGKFILIHILNSLIGSSGVVGKSSTKIQPHGSLARGNEQKMLLCQIVVSSELKEQSSLKIF